MNTITLNDKQYIVKRCGIILYHKIKEHEYKILLGLKRKYCRYGDIGGGIKKNEKYINGLIREIQEESSNIIFENKREITKNIVNAKRIFYETKDKGLYIEYLIECPYSTYYNTHFLDHKIDEHLEFRWFNIKNGKILDFDIKENLDGSLRPLIDNILLFLS